MEFELVELRVLLVVAGSALCAAIGGSLAYRKNYHPLRGFVLGGLLGPLGVALVVRLPFVHRPMIDRGAWESFRSMVEHQSNSEILQLAAMQGRMLPAPARVTPRR